MILSRWFLVLLCICQDSFLLFKLISNNILVYWHDLVAFNKGYACLPLTKFSQVYSSSVSNSACGIVSVYAEHTSNICQLRKKKG